MIRPFLLCAALILPAPLPATETLRIATFEPGLTRDGAGVLLHDLTTNRKPETAAAVAVIQAARPDVLLLTRFDHDLRGQALAALRERLRTGPDGIDYRHWYHEPVNAGMASGLDLDDDGRLMGADDAFGWGRYPGHGGMAILSRLPIDTDTARSFREFRWADLPGARLPTAPDGAPWPDAERQAALRLSSRTHWDVPVVLPDGGRLHLLASAPTPPLFDGPERRNRLRNHDEVAFWRIYLDGAALADDAGRTAGPPAAPVVVLGNLAIDPGDGAGDPAALRRLLAHPRLQDPAPASAGGAAASAAQGGVNAGHAGPPARDTADWRDDAGGPGNLRVDYVLPDARLAVAGSGVFWPAPGAPLAAQAAAASDHRLVWVDVALP